MRPLEQRSANIRQSLLLTYENVFSNDTALACTLSKQQKHVRQDTGKKVFSPRPDVEIDVQMK